MYGGGGVREGEILPGSHHRLGGWQPNWERMREIYRIVDEHQPIGVSGVANRMGIPRAVVINSMVAMGNNGLLLTEDEKGRLYTF